MTPTTTFLKQQITLPDILGVTEDVEQHRNDLIAASQSITTITDAVSNNTAREAVVAMRQWVKDVKEMGLKIRRPIDAVTKQVKTIEDDHLSPLLEQIARIERLGTDYALAEQRRVEAAEAARREALAEAERVRLAAEDAARKAASRMTTDAGMEKALAAEQKAAAAEQAVQTIIAAPMPSVERARGQTFGKDLKWEVTDLMALVKSRPDLCKIEPKASAINSSCVPEMPNPPPGLRLWWEPRSTFTTR